LGAGDCADFDEGKLVMSKQTEKQRIIALQKALRIAKAALERVQFDGRTHQVEDALDEINKLDWNSKPNLIQDRSAQP